MNNIYETNYSEYVKNDELNKSTKMYNAARNPLKTGIVPKPAYSTMFSDIDNENEIVSTYFTSLTGEKVKKEGFKHNNMQPFLKGNITQNTDIYSDSGKVSRDTGVGGYYFRKKEVENFFQPNVENINGNQENVSFLQDRIEVSKIFNNTLPFEQVKVAPGLNKGFTSTGSGGFQQADTLNYAQPKPIEELRSKVNQKESFFEIPIKAAPKGIDKLGEITPFMKNKPETVYEQSSENWFKTTGAITKNSIRPVLALKEPTKQSGHIEYKGNASAEIIKGVGAKDDYGRKTIIIYDNTRNETQKKTVVSNFTSIIKAITNPITDALKISTKEYLINSARAAGNPQVQIPSKPSTYDPSDVFKTTVKETLVHDSDILNLSANDKKVYSALFDLAKTTIKETLLHDGDTLNLSGNDKKVYTALVDLAKTTVKETLLHDGDTLNLSGINKKVYRALEDLAKTTVKETLVHDDDILNLSGNDKKFIVHY